LILNEKRNSTRSKQRRVVDFIGAVVPLRAREVPQSLPEDADLSNVVPISSRKRIGPDKRVPEVMLAQDGRPAPLTRKLDRRRTLALFVIGSCVVHASLFAAFNREPEPLASVGEISISAELVLGTNRAAGRERAPSESEISSPAAPKKDEPVAERAEAPQKAVEDKTQEDAPRPVETAKDKTPDAAAPAVTAAISPDPVAELPLPQEKPVETQPTKPVEQTKPTEHRHEPVPAKKRAKDSDEGKSNRKRVTPASTPSVASNSIGRGRSDASSNYRGLVAAHLARYKQFPSDARSRGDQGTATVTFGLDGGGRVTSVRLARGSGVSSIDQETQAMVRRASPFPAPPDGRAQSFTVPVQFYLR
jgi:protein TonB